ncbi:hypothetical protein GQ53DRAFT_740162 [Thozetella sp. PMI_491]|nr:hypothetical protein GQ53DRAFT_740162 [Thozetella sp. PMI_491]
MASNHWPWVILAIFRAVEPALAVPAVSFPINSQVPPAARVGQPFSFNFSASTFSSSAPMSYALNEPPSWLSIDSGARRIYGTPGDGDIGPGQVVGVPIELVATDDTGSTILSSTLVVSRNPSPNVAVPLMNQIPAFGVFSAPSSILSYPDKAFGFDLINGTFSNPLQQPLNYYAVTDDNTPLPAWISFDPSKLSFAGTTPPLATLIQPPQAFGFQLIASDITGFAAAILPFTIVVGSHALTATQTHVDLNGTIGALLSYTGLRDIAEVDGQPAKDSHTTVVATGDMPDWLSLDKDTWEIHGTPPQHANSTTFTVTLNDLLSDTLNITVSVNVTGTPGGSEGAFMGNLPELQIIPGRHFAMELSPYLTQPKDVIISVSTNPPLSWIRVEADSNTISGDAPVSLQDSVIEIRVHAQSRGSGRTDTETLSLHVQIPEISATNTRSLLSATASTSTESSTTPTDDTGPLPGANDASGNPPHVTLVAILVPLLVLASVLFTMLLCYLRRRRQRAARRPMRGDISGPLPGSFVMNSGAEEAAHMYDIGKQCEIESPSSANAKGGQREYLEPASRDHSESDIPPMPDMTKINALKNRIRSGADAKQNGSRRSWLTAAAVGVLKPGKQARKSKSRSYLSDTSLYPDPNEAVDRNSMTFFGNGSRTSFRDALEVNIPEIVTPSVQHTPDIAYSGHDGPRAQQITSHRGVLEDYEQARNLPRRFQDEESSPDGTGWTSWGRSGSGHLVKTIKKQASLLSMATMDTFAHKKKPKLPISPDMGYSEEDIHVPRLRPAKLAEQTDTTQASCRKGPSHSRWFGSKTTTVTRGPSTKTTQSEGEASDAPRKNIGRMSLRSIPAGAMSVRTPRDSLGIAYSDLVNKSPFHPSSSWSTIQSIGDEGPAEHETSRDEGRGVPPDNPDATPSTPPNWTILEESPIIKDWRGADSGKADLMSPSRWPQVQKRSPSPREPPAKARDLEPRAGPKGTLVSDTAALGAPRRRARDAQYEGEQAAINRGLGDGSAAKPGVVQDGDDYPVYI